MQMVIPYLPYELVWCTACQIDTIETLCIYMVRLHTTYRIWLPSWPAKLIRLGHYAYLPYYHMGKYGVLAAELILLGHYVYGHTTIWDSMVYCLPSWYF